MAQYMLTEAGFTAECAMIDAQTKIRKIGTVEECRKAFKEIVKNCHTDENIILFDNEDFEDGGEFNISEKQEIVKKAIKEISERPITIQFEWFNDIAIDCKTYQILEFKEEF